MCRMAGGLGHHRMTNGTLCFDQLGERPEIPLVGVTGATPPDGRFPLDGIR